MERKHIVSLHGSYYVNNYGDILLINIFYHWVKDQYPSFIVNLPFVDKNRIKEMPEPSTTGFFNLLKSECLIFVGGGYFGEQPKRKGVWSIRNFIRHGIVGLAAIVFKIPIAIIGVEVGPLSKKWFRRVVLKIVKSAKVVIVRNEESVDFLSKYGINNVQLTADAVLTLNREMTDVANGGNNYVVMHIPGYSNYKKEIEALVRYVCEGILHSKMDIDSIIFIEDSPGQYSNAYTDIFDIVSRFRIPYTVKQYIGTKEVIDTIKNSTAVFTTKLHVGITAAAYNRKVFSTYSHPKTKRLHSQIGNSQNCVALSDLLNERTGIKEKIFAFLKQKSFSLPHSVLASANKNRDVLESFIRDSVFKR